MMLKIVEKLGYQTGTMVEVCKNHRPTTFLRAIFGFWVTLTARFVKRDFNCLQFEKDFDIIVQLEGLVA